MNRVLISSVFVAGVLLGQPKPVEVKRIPPPAEGVPFSGEVPVWEADSNLGG